MKKKWSSYKVLFLFCIFLFGSFSGCFEEDKKRVKEILVPQIEVNQPSILPNWNNGDYHDYDDTMLMLNEFNDNYPDLVDVFSIGKSTRGRDIWCIKITVEDNRDDKLSGLIDGCMHGNEWEGGEACLYLAEYLLINFENNKTITTMLNTTRIYLIPLVNPDGREADERFTDNGVDPNRNFDVFFW